MKVLLISPPFIQLNSPYSSLPYLKGTLGANSIECRCLDLGIKVANRLFSGEGLIKLKADLNGIGKNADADFFLSHADEYINSVDKAVTFLKGVNPAFEDAVLDKRSLPRYKMSLSAVEKRNISSTEYARYLTSLYLEDIFLFYKAACPDYGLSRYAESLSVSPAVFDPVRRAVETDDLISRFINDELESFDIAPYGLIALTVPFPGTLAGALKAAKNIRKNFPGKTIVLGGGYVNTELRSLKDPRIFEFADYICLDDGEAPLVRLVSHIEGKSGQDSLLRTFYLENGRVVFRDGSEADQSIKRGTPDYSDIDLSDYIPVIETLNPMMKLWSENDTLKLRLARGCYWHKCAFCDTILPYIRNYSADGTEELISDIKKMTAQTGLDIFHFVDEAIPPALAINLSLALLRENTKIKWWGNFRFDPAFTGDVCRLLKEAGCIAAVGGLESACGRTLKRMNKGITVEEAVKAAGNFSSAGILVHAYMIYAFPKESDNDIIESLEVLRQMFASGIVQSAYYHRFALTVHSAVFAQPDKHGVKVTGKQDNPFANNDTSYEDLSGNDPDRFGDGLKKAVYNWMHGAGTDKNIRSWFSFTVPEPKIKKDFVKKILNSPTAPPSLNKRIVWLGKGSDLRGSNIVINGLNGELEYELPQEISKWLKELLDSADIKNQNTVRLTEAMQKFPNGYGITFMQFLCNEIWDELFEAGLLII